MTEEIDDKWGDDQLTATSVSAPRLLARSDWEAFFHSRGYSEPYPLVLYSSDEADQLYSDLLTVAGKSQAPDSDPRLHISVFTRFVDREDAQAEGALWLVIEHIDAVEESLRDDLMTLLRSGSAHWMKESYSSHGVTPEIVWVEQLPPDLEAKAPDQIPREGTQRIYRALIRQ